MAATVTLTAEQVQDLIQRQTGQFQQMMTTQLAALQLKLEKSFDEKLKFKFEEAEENVKQFMKESMEEEDPATSVSVITQTTHMESLVKDCCIRLEEIVQQKTAIWELQQPPPPPSPQPPRGSTPRRTKSMGVDMGSASTGTVSALRASQQHMEDLIETRLKAMEQFIDNRHAELEAYYSSSNDTLKKIFLEIVQGIPSSNSMRANNGGSFSSIAPGHALTREELVAVLDDRVMAEKATGTRPITKDELEAILDARIHDDEEMDTPKPLTREELEAVLDARINAVEAEEEEVKRAMQSQDPAESSSSSNGGKSLHLAMEKLILHVKELIEIHSSTEDLEHQIQSRLDQLEAAEKAPTNFQRFEAKLESIEKLVLASIATSPRKKQRSSSKKPSKKLTQIIPDKDTPNDDTTTKAYVEDSSRRNQNSGATNRASNGYSDVSVDEEGLDESEEKVEENQAAGGDRVKNFMKTLTNWRHLNEEQHGVRDHGATPPASSEDKDKGDRGVLAPSDIDEGDDDIDSMDISVDSSDGEGDDDNKVLELLQRLETKLDQLQDEKKRNHDDADHAALPPLDGIHHRERSTNARHSREIVLNTDSISESIREEHSKLKRWIMEQQDEMINSDRQSEIALGDPHRGAPDRPADTTSVDAKVLHSIQEKLDSIENAVTTNQSLLQELRRQGVPEVLKELPMLEPLGGNGMVNLEQKILSHLDNMDKSVQFKLDEIYREMQPTASRRESDWSTMSTEDQSAIVSAIQRQLQEIKEAIIEHLRESIPDYEMAKSVLSENLEELREIVSEVAISEVELLKTQLGVAEESEQEALHAIVVLREQLEEAREAERRALYMPRVATQPQSPERSGNAGLWNFGPFGQLLGQQLSAPPRQQHFQSRRFSAGQQSHTSGLTHHSASRGLNYNSSITSNANKFRSPKQKLEDWKNQISDLDEKATDLRMLYSQLRGQQPGEWMDQGRLQLSSDFGAGKGGMQSSAGLGAGETKEMEVEVKVGVEMKPQGSSDGDNGGDWI